MQGSSTSLLALRAAEHLKLPLDVILQGEVVHVLHNVGVSHAEDAGAHCVTLLVRVVTYEGQIASEQHWHHTAGYSQVLHACLLLVGVTLAHL